MAGQIHVFEGENLTSPVVIHELYVFAFTFNFCKNGRKGGRVKLDFYPFYSYEANLGFEFSEAHDGLKKSQATLYADYFKNIY